MPTRQQILAKFNGNEQAMSEHYRKIGTAGGSAPHKRPRWFKENPELAAIAGVKSGRVKRKRINEQKSVDNT